MSNGRTHRALGTIAREGYTLVRPSQQGSEHVLLEALGAADARHPGAPLPDVIDLPLHPGRRRLPHRIVLVGTTGRVAVTTADGSHAGLNPFIPACLPLVA